MAKLKNSFTGQGSKKPPTLSPDEGLTSSFSKSLLSRDKSVRNLSQTSGTPVPKALKFGTFHTKAASSSQSGSSWTSLLKSASGGGGGLLGGGLLSSSGFGLISKLFGLFGGGKAAAPVPVQFQSPVPQQNSLKITNSGSSPAVALGVHPLTGGGSTSGVYQQTGLVTNDHGAQSSQVIQIVKRALLTSSSLNDVISEI